MKEERKLVFPGREMRLAMFDDEIEMRADQAGKRGRNHPNVGGKEALKGQRAQVRAAAQGFEDKAADQRNTARDLRPNGRRPIGPLIPGKQVTRKAHADRRQQETDADQPGHLARIFVGGGHKYA